MAGNPKYSVKRNFLINFVAGIGWALGMTVGLSLVMAIFWRMFQAAGGLPLIGDSIQGMLKPIFDLGFQNQPFKS